MGAFEFPTWLEGQRVKVDALLDECLARLEGADSLKEAMGYSLRVGGKRLRPILCLSFAEAFGLYRTLWDDAACALEFVHTYSLIHDDLPAMDNADLRRGQPSCHKRFSESLAILAGDALLTDAFSLLTKTTDERELSVRARLVSELAFASGAAGMVSGQVLDMADNRPATKAYLLDMHARKTGALIRASCRMGAIAAGASEEGLSRATRYGECVGLAFQIADDILDVTSSAEVLGKPVGQDAGRKTPTFPDVMGLAESKAFAQKLCEEAVAQVAPLEPLGGPLTALAYFTVERSQ